MTCCQNNVFTLQREESHMEPSLDHMVGSPWHWNTHSSVIFHQHNFSGPSQSLFKTAKPHSIISSMLPHTATTAVESDHHTTLLDHFINTVQASSTHCVCVCVRVCACVRAHIYIHTAKFKRHCSSTLHFCVYMTKLMRLFFPGTPCLYTTKILRHFFST